MWPLATAGRRPTRGCPPSPCAISPFPRTRCTRRGTGCAARVSPWPRGPSTWSTPPPSPSHRPRDAPVVATVHDLAFLDDSRLATRHGHRFFRRGMELARAEAAIVMTPSEVGAGGVRAQRLRPHSPQGRPVGDRPGAGVGADIDRVLGHYRIDRPFVLFCGTLEPRKNVRRVVDAFRRLGRSGHELVLVGPDGWNEDVRTLLAGLDGRARTLGFVPRADLDPLYAAATVFCYPSLQEGFGLPVLEAMAQGTPVVTSSGTATEEVAGDTGLLVDPTDTAAIAAALELLVDDPEVAARLGRAGPRRAEQFTWARSAELVTAAYREAAAFGSRPERG